MLLSALGVACALTGIYLNSRYDSPGYYSHQLQLKEDAQINQIDSPHLRNNLKESPAAPTFTWTRNNYTFANFNVESDTGTFMKLFRRARNKPFELFDDFDLSSKIIGNETWKDMLVLRRDLQRPSLSFYVDKVARKRWLPKVGLPSPKAFMVNYGTELTKRGKIEEEQMMILKHLPENSDFAAKPTHLSCSGGVWLTKYDADTNTTLISHGTKPFKKKKGFQLQDIADSLAKDLHEGPRCGSQIESWALENVKPGVMVEERFINVDGDDDSGCMEFKAITIWGRVWLVHWRPGISKVRAFLRRDGSTLQWDENQSHPLPDWVDWQRIIGMAEQLGAHKDMFRTDIYVGVPVGSLPKNTTRQERLDAVQYVLSETAVHPTPLKGSDEIFEEAGRLWLGGYMIGNFKIISNTEVPSEFLASGMLASRGE